MSLIGGGAGIGSSHIEFWCVFIFPFPGMVRETS